MHRKGEQNLASQATRAKLLRRPQAAEMPRSGWAGGSSTRSALGVAKYPDPVLHLLRDPIVAHDWPRVLASRSIPAEREGAKELRRRRRPAWPVPHQRLAHCGHIRAARPARLRARDPPARARRLVLALSHNPARRWRKKRSGDGRTAFLDKIIIAVTIVSALACAARSRPKRRRRDRVRVVDRV